MLFSKEEIRRARKLKEAGLLWRVQIGHWYVTKDGFVGLVRGQGEAVDCQNMHTWIPEWSDCRSWLKDRGYGHPEFIEDEVGQVTLALRHRNEGELRVRGTSDLCCLYDAMDQILTGSRRAE